MKAKRLLNLGMMLACGVSLQAQTSVFHESFDAAQTKQPTDVAWYEFINQKEGDEFTINNEEAFAGTGCLEFFNTIEEGNWWDRAVKFRNLPLQEGKSYRLTWRFKGTNTWSDGENTGKSKMNVALMQGGENADIPLLDANGNEFRYEVSYFNPESYEKYTKMFYFASAQLQKDTYAEKNPDKEPLADTFFATFNVFNPGAYYLDEVNLSESPIAGVYYAGDVIKVDFGYATNIASMAKASPIGIVQMPQDCATVKLNGADAEVDCIELHSDGYLYIFLTDGVDEGSQIEVAFKNPENATYQIQYTGNMSPEGAAFDFAGETAEFQDGLEEIYSWAYTEPVLVEATPADGSFRLDENTISEVTFTFDKPVLTTNVDGEPLVCTVNGSEQMELVTEAGEEGTKTLTFKRANGETFGKGAYAVSLSGIVSDKYTEAPGAFATSFEVGKVKVAETVYNFEADYKTVLGTDNGIPTGWTLTLGETVHEGGSGPLSGCSRGFVFNEGSNVQSAVYLRNWEGKAVLTSNPVTIPEGNVELRAFTAGWAGTGILKMTIKNSNDEEVLSENISVSTNINRDKSAKLQVTPFRLQSDGGEYTCVVELGEGSEELLFAGFEVYSYYETEGDKTETEIIAKGDFAAAGNDYAPAHGTGWKIYRPNGDMRDPGANCTWGGNDWTRGGGPRVKTLGNKGLNGAGIYLGGGCYATYGEYLVQTDHGGEVLTEDGATTPEQTLDVKAGKYNVTYYILGWKNPGSVYNITLDVYNQADGITGTPVYTRVDNVEGTADSGNNSADEAKKVQFFWNAPADGKYILKFTAGGEGEGEAVVGNVSIETTSSLAVQYALLMNKALEPAKEELEEANAKEEYRGATRDALAQAIEDYTDPDFHSVAEYDEAFANLDNIVKQSKKRRSNIDAYPTSLQALVDGLEAARGTMYEKLEQFPIVEAAYNNYKDVDYVALNDDELAAAVAEMGNNGTLLTNMVKTCVPLLTNQITQLAAAIVKLDPEMESNEVVLAAGKVLDDDQELVSKLKMLYAANLYNMVASGQDPFNVLDEDIMEEVYNPIEASFLIQNPQFYCTAQVVNGNVSSKATDYPGWTIDVAQGSITSIFTTAWDGPYPTDVKPVENCAVKTGWGNSEYDVKQMIGQLPVFKYSASIKIGEDGGEPHGCYAYCGDEQLVYEGQDGEYTRDNNKEANLKEFTEVTPVYEEGETLGTITLGAHMTIAGGFGNVDNATLVITDKDPNFDYAAAAKKLEEEYTAVNNVEVPAGEPVSVRYYDLSGKMVAQPKGVSIKIATYANGVTTVSKFVAE